MTLPPEKPAEPDQDDEARERFTDTPVFRVEDEEMDEEPADPRDAV